MTAPTLQDPLLKVREVAVLIGLGRTTTYGLIMSGEIASVRIGRSRRVRKSDVDTYIANLQPDAAQS